MIGNRGLRPPEETPQQGPKQLVQKVSLKWWDEANAECSAEGGHGGRLPVAGPANSVRDTTRDLGKTPGLVPLASFLQALPLQASLSKEVRSPHL